MKIKYDDMTEREKQCYALGYVTGMCRDCKARYRHDDYDKLQGHQDYCINCKKKAHVNFIIKSQGIEIA